MRQNLMRFFCAAALLTATRGGCATDEDCGLLGDCVSGLCVCDLGWLGPACTTLNLLPAPVDSGLRQANSSNWCGTILQDETDPELFHSYNADFGGCKNGLSIWFVRPETTPRNKNKNLKPHAPK